MGLQSMRHQTSCKLCRQQHGLLGQGSLWPPRSVSLRPSRVPLATALFPVYLTSPHWASKALSSHNQEGSLRSFNYPDPFRLPTVGQDLAGNQYHLQDWGWGTVGSDNAYSKNQLDLDQWKWECLWVLG